MTTPSIAVPPAIHLVIIGKATVDGRSTRATIGVLKRFNKRCRADSPQNIDHEQ